MDALGWFAFGTMVATFVGPIAAVVIGRMLEDRRAIHFRQWEVFRALMRSRRQPLSLDFVGALNLIEVEFHDKPAVRTAWRNLLNHYNQASVASDEQAQIQNQQRAQLITTLLDQIARVLRIQVEQLDIFAGGYSPVGWFETELEAQTVRKFFAQMARGERGLPIVAHQPEPANPPAPGAA